MLQNVQVIATESTPARSCGAASGTTERIAPWNPPPNPTPATTVPAKKTAAEPVATASRTTPIPAHERDRAGQHGGPGRAPVKHEHGDGAAGGEHEQGQAARQERMTRRLATYDDPRERLLGVFDLLAESIADPGFHGCAFVNASAESPAGSAAEEATTEYRTWVRSLLTDLARDAGASDPAELARQLQLLYDGVNISARMDRDPSAATVARAAAVTLLRAVTAR